MPKIPVLLRGLLGSAILCGVCAWPLVAVSTAVPAASAALSAAPSAATSALSRAPVAPAAAAQQTLLVFGDSLSAGYGLDAGRGWVALLQQRLQAQALPWQVVNASVSGETTAGGRARLDATLMHFQPAVVVLELGGNDGLRGQPVASMQANLAAMIAQIRAKGAQPLLLGMRIPNNYGAAYAGQFAAAYAALAQTQQVPFVPFFLAAVATDRARWFQDDGIHPNAEAQPQMLDAVWPQLQSMLQSAAVP